MFTFCSCTIAGLANVESSSSVPIIVGAVSVVLVSASVAALIVVVIVVLRIKGTTVS